MSVDSSRSTISGSLTWLGTDSGGFPLTAALSLAAVVSAGGALVVFVRRRRRGAERVEAW